MGNAQLVDSMVHDGLWRSSEQCHMGNAGELIATEYNVGRAAQDEFAFNSHRGWKPTRRPFKRSSSRNDPAEERRPDRRRARRVRARRHLRHGPRC